MGDSNVTEYRPGQRLELGMLGVWPKMIRNLASSRELIWHLFKRDFFAVYKKSFLGVGWVLVAPLIGVMQWVFLQQTGLLSPGQTEIPYPLWVLLGTSMWGLFAGYMEHATDSLNAGRSLILQINFPHEALLIKQAAQMTATFLIGFGMNLVVLMAFGVWPSWATLLLPLVALPLFFLGGGIGLVLAMLAAIAGDVKSVLKVGLGLLLLAVPVVYETSQVGERLRWVIEWNPLTHLVCSCRDIVLFGRLYDPTGYFVSAGISILVFMFCWRLFYITEHRIVERMV